MDSSITSDHDGIPLLSELTIKQLTTKFQGYKTKWKEWLIIDNILGWG